MRKARLLNSVYPCGEDAMEALKTHRPRVPAHLSTSLHAGTCRCWWQDQQSVPPPPVGVRGIMKSPWRNPEHYIGAVAGTQWWIDARDRLKWTNLQAHFVERNDRGLQASKAPWATSLQTRERGSKHSRSSRNQQARATALSNQQMNPSQQPD